MILKPNGLLMPINRSHFIKNALVAMVASIVLIVVFFNPVVSHQVKVLDAQQESYDSFFDGLSENCQLPCWRNLTLGESDVNEFVDVLNDLPDEQAPELNELFNRNFRPLVQ